MNNAYMDIKTVTTEFVALASARTQGTFEIRTSPGNTGNVTFKGENGVDVEWVPGESHTFRDVDLSTFLIKGTAGDLVAILKDSINGGILSEKSTDSLSTLYNGGGTDNALQLAANETALAALDPAPASITIPNAVDAIRVWLMNTTAGQGCYLCVGQFDASGNLIDMVETKILTTDQVFDTDQDAWGLTTGTDKPAKTPEIIVFERNSATSYLKIWNSQSDGGAWYARYQLGSIR